MPPWGKYCIVWGEILSKTMGVGGKYLVKREVFYKCVKTELSNNF